MHLPKRWPWPVLCLVTVAGLYVLSVVENPLQKRSSSDAEVATEAPVGTEARPPRENPLLEIQRSGQRVSSMQRQGVVKTFTRNVQSRWKPTAAEHVLDKSDNMSAFDYEACSSHNTMCVVSYPLPASIFPHTVTFCVHSGNDIVSNDIRSSGVWEFPWAYFIWATLVQIPDMHFIDMGANIGTLSLLAAKLGRQVIAVEPLKATVDILCQSVIENSVTDKVTIVPFPLSDQRTVLKTMSAPNNWGDTRLYKDVDAKEYSETVTTILTDDLLKFISFKTAFLKVDIQGFEPAAMRSAVKLFDQVHIPVVMMEWVLMKENIVAGNSDPLFILEFFYSRGYSAYSERGVKLDRATPTSWTYDIHWIHDDFTYEVDPWSVF